MNTKLYVLVLVGAGLLGAAACGVELPEEELTDDTVLDGDTVWEGRVELEDLVVPVGVTVTAAGTLELVVNDLDVQGRIVGASGVDITIIASGNVSIAGAVEAGAGDGAAAQAPTAVLSGDDGQAGGRLAMYVEGNVTVAGIAAAGDGGAGGDATANATEEDPRAIAVGGIGGRGGDLVIEATALHVPGAVRLGSGGPGGSATADGPASMGREATGGDGGAPGEFGIRVGELTGVDYDAEERPEGTLLIVRRGLEGGAGGDGGPAGLPMSQELRRGFDASGLVGRGVAAGPGHEVRARPEPRAGGTCAVGGGKNGDHGVVGGGNGVSSWFRPGNGQSATAFGGDGILMGVGGSAHATGGRGGDVAPANGLEVAAIPGTILLLNAAAKAGDGGDATAYGGWGGESGGDGGDAYARAGDGGDAAVAAVISFTSLPDGGDGGLASAFGGAAENGFSCCNPPMLGQDGGDSGGAHAFGGNGGSGTRGGDGGDADTIAEYAGAGGDGSTPGKGGAAGMTVAVPGKGGTGVRSGFNGTADDDPGGRGEDGVECEVADARGCVIPSDCEEGQWCGLEPGGDEFVCLDVDAAPILDDLELVFGYAGQVYDSAEECDDAVAGDADAPYAEAVTSVLTEAELACSAGVAVIWSPADFEVFTLTCGDEYGEPETLTIDVVGYAECLG